MSRDSVLDVGRAAVYALIVAVVGVLGWAGRVSSDAVVAVLGAVAGYVAGRAAGERGGVLGR